jgi:hypothetical protein
MKNKTKKFRAWNTSKKKFVSDSMLDDLFINSHGDVYDIFTNYEIGPRSSVIKDDVTDIMVIDYNTGVKDCEGRYIYENDFIRSDKKVYIIKWHKAYSGYQYCMIDKEGEPDDFYGGIGNRDCCIIVGNIHDYKIEGFN